MKKIKNPFAGLEDKGYNCFACCPSNPYGLKMEFFEDGEDIVCFWDSRGEYQSWVNTLHGGIQATILDEIGGWVVSRKLQTTGMTSHLNVKYRQPAPAGDGIRLEVRARLKQMRRNLAFIEATISHDGQVCSSADMIYYCFPKDKAEKDFLFKGCELED